MRGVDRWILAAGAAFLLLAAAPAFAATPECAEECAEARVVCQAAAHEAYRTCQEACTDGDDACVRTCRWAFSAAKAICEKQRQECREACLPDGTCSCVAGCAARLEACRDGLRECRAECRDDTRDRLARCRTLAENGAPAPIVRACVQNAERQGEECSMICQGVLSCGSRFARCVERCDP